jgi:chromosome segregation ATPase
MSYESARKTLAHQVKNLQTALTRAHTEIQQHEQETVRAKRNRDEILRDIKETAGALSKLGGPVPDWTDDADLIAFWDEIKDA